jgi:hypothetical protein
LNENAIYSLEILATMDTRYRIFLEVSILMIILIFSYNLSNMKTSYIPSDFGIQKIENTSRFYTIWKQFDLKEGNFQYDCSKKIQYKSFSNLKNIAFSWEKNSNLKCRKIYESFKRIFEIRLNKIEIKFPEIVFKRFQKTLKSKNPFKSITNIQVINCIIFE